MIRCLSIRWSMSCSKDSTGSRYFRTLLLSKSIVFSTWTKYLLEKSNLLSSVKMYVATWISTFIQAITRSNFTSKVIYVRKPFVFRTALRTLEYSLCLMKRNSWSAKSGEWKLWIRLMVLTSLLMISVSSSLKIPLLMINCYWWQA